MGDSLARGMVLSLSVWDDYAAQMLWLDSNYPTDKSASTPGVSRGPCATTSGKPAEVEAQSPNASVTFSNIRYGDIGSTYSSTGSVTSASTTAGGSATQTSSSAASTATGTVAQWGQCGGTNYNGPTVCASPYTCHKVNDCKFLSFFFFE
jgi:cellulose 1,4-beta-cellobiosidase